MAVTRTLLRADLPALEALLLGLNAEDRQRRFGLATGDGGIAKHCAAIAEAGRSTRVIGAFEGERLVAAAELWFSDEAALPDCEVAVVVDAAWRGRGLGKQVLGRAILVARNRWARRLHMTCLLENRRMQLLARQFAQELRFEDGSAEAEILLPYPSWHSLWAEAVLDAAGLAASVWQLGRAASLLTSGQPTSAIGWNARSLGNASTSS